SDSDHSDAAHESPPWSHASIKIREGPPPEATMEFGAEAGELRVLTEETLILAAVAGACVLLVLGVLELVWPTRPPRARRTPGEAAPPRPILAPPPRPVQSILPRRLIDSPSARSTGG